MNNSITAVCVVYRTKDLVQTAIESFRSFYPEIPIVVVDNSAREGKCTRYLREIANQDDNTRIFVMSENIGHGPGMDYAIRNIDTDWVYIFDSDTEMIKPGIIEAAGPLMEGRTILATGHMQLVSCKGRGNGETKDPANIPYIHPAICFINKQLYLKYPPFRYHGAPCIDTYVEIFKQGLSDDLLYEFPVELFVYHKWRGTRSFYKMKPWVN